jgi:hypothetical protein
MVDSSHRYGLSMNRQLKTFEQLRSLLAQEVLQQQKFGAVQPRLIALSERDASGCNWSVGGWVAPRGPERQSCPELLQLVRTYQSRFNAVGRSPGNATALLPPAAQRAGKAPLKSGA